MDTLHMECSESRTCVCKPNHISKGNAICVSILDEFCSTEYDCGNLMHVTCIENKCVCRPHHRLFQNTTCLSLLGGFCESSKECGAIDSICEDNQCKCKSKFIIATPDRCILSKYHLSLNFKKTCKKIVKTCSFTGPLGNRCVDDHDCREIFHSKCSTTGTCVCQDNYVMVNETTCSPLLDELCFEDEPCGLDNSVCKGDPKVCQCQDNFKSISNYECVPSKFFVS